MVKKCLFTVTVWNREGRRQLVWRDTQKHTHSDKHRHTHSDTH